MKILTSIWSAQHLKRWSKYTITINLGDPKFRKKDLATLEMTRSKIVFWEVSFCCVPITGIILKFTCSASKWCKTLLHRSWSASLSWSSKTFASVDCPEEGSLRKATFTVYLVTQQSFHLIWNVIFNWWWWCVYFKVNSLQKINICYHKRIFYLILAQVGRCHGHPKTNTQYLLWHVSHLTFH